MSVLALPSCGDDSSAADAGRADDGGTTDAAIPSDAAASFDAADDDADRDDAGPSCETTLQARVRDFQIAHEDFEYAIGVDPGVVELDLGADQKPVYAGAPTTPTTTGAENFNEWFSDVAGTNQPFEIPIEFVETEPGLYEYSENAFFPIDDQGFGNEGNIHNFHFTTELHTRFLYEGGEVLTFEGDDDVFVFVNGKLDIDLGGVHGPLEGSIDMDDRAAYLGIEVGEIYDIHLFQAERHTTQSNFSISTTIDCFIPL